MRRDVLVIALSALGVRVALVAVLGIREGPDSSLYIREATAWQMSGAGELLELFVSSETRSPLFVALIAVLQSLFSGWQAPLVAIQTLLSAALPVAMYFAALRSGLSRGGAWVAALLSIGSYELSRWNAYLLTDALFIVFSGAAMCAAIYALSARSVGWALIAATLVVASMLERPAGPAVAIAVILAACLIRPPARPVVYAAVATFGVVVALEMYIVSTGARASIAIHGCRQLIEGRVIFGFPSFSIAPLADVSLAENVSTAECLWQVARDHPGHVANVIARRAIVYWLPVYPNYSLTHNLANVVLLGVPLVLAAFALFDHLRAFRDDLLRVVSASFVLAFGLFHTATWSEGDHRFLAPVLPAVYLLAARAVDRLLPP